jgi:GNAT superfamily N-acetyltransferase
MIPTNPAYLTSKEYLQATNQSRKWHEGHAYNWSLDQINNGYGSSNKNTFPKLLGRKIIKGLTFEFRQKDESEGPMIGVWNEEGQKVGGTQDEWGAMLVYVAKEYRGFGLGPMLIKIARTLEPMKDSGGFTDAGRNNLVKAHREFVRDALKNGTYTKLVRSGQMSIERVKEIVDSAHLSMRPKADTEDLSSKPQDWLLYVGGYGDFILYDKKLKNLIGRDDREHFHDQMIKGYVLVREPRDGKAIIVRFGGQNDKFKTFMMTCAIWWANKEGATFDVDPEDVKYVDKRFAKVSPKHNMQVGHTRYRVTVTGEIPNFNDFAMVEKHWRKQNDQYDEFKNYMMDLANSIYQPQPVVKDRWAA